MLSYKDYLQVIFLEGIIKVNKELLSFMKSALVVHFGNDVFSLIENDEAKNILRDYIDNHKKNRDSYIIDKGIKNYKDDSYRNLVYDNNGFYCKFDYFLGVVGTNSSHGASFFRNRPPALSAIKVTYDRIFVQEFSEWTQTPSLESLDNIFQKKSDQIEHELAHLIEWIIMTDTENIKGAKKNYNDVISDYFTSDIEFEPMIISAIRNFERIIRDRFFKDKEIMTVKEYEELVKTYLSAKVIEDIDDSFIRYNKDKRPKNYKIIVRKVYIELMNNIEELITQGYLQK